MANDAVQLTLNNAVMGSAHYLAPETAQGKDPDPKIDIYSMGIVFYELLTGSVPFQGKTQRRLRSSICVNQFHLSVILIQAFLNQLKISY